MVVMPLMLTLLWCEYTWFTDVQGWGKPQLTGQRELCIAKACNSTQYEGRY